MKIKLYTKSYNKRILEKIDSKNDYFSSEEHSAASRLSYKNLDAICKERIINNYIVNNGIALSQLKCVLEFIDQNKCKQIVSFGSGESVLEYLLSICLNESKLYAVDFDKFYIENGKKYLEHSNLTIDYFDFFSSKTDDLFNKHNIKPDLCIFFGSSYVLDDDDFIIFFNNLKKIGVKNVIDFYAGCVNYFDIVKYYLKYFSKKGKFHGYGRTKSLIRKLHKKSGWKSMKEINVANYKIVSFLK